MSDYMMDVANSHLDYQDKGDVAFERAPKRWVFDEEELMVLADTDFETSHEAVTALMKIKAYQQWQKPNGEWEWM